MLTNFKKKNEEYRLEGSITVYLVLIFELVLILLITSITDARRRAMVLRAKTCLDMGLYSVFGEYNRELFDKYDIFAIDTTYGGKSSDYRYTESHLLEYMRYNIHPTEGYMNYGVGDLFRLNADVAMIDGYELMTDDGGAPLVRQITEYMKSCYGINIVEGLLEDYQAANNGNLLGDDAEKQLAESQHAIDKAKEDNADAEWVSTFENPADQINTNRSAGILRLVVDDMNSLSQQVTDTKVLCSNRNRAVGVELTLLQSCEENESINVDKLLQHMIVDEYCIRKLGSYRTAAEEEPLRYQLEYLIGGHNSDVENLKDTCNRLVAIREASNMMHILGDKDKRRQADDMAAEVTEAVPQLKYPVMMTIIASWAFAESVLDVRLLLHGHKIPLTKSDKDWHLSIDNLKNYKDFLRQFQVAKETDEDEKGLDYVGYLRLLLAATDMEKVVYRLADIMELYLRTRPGNTYFCMDACLNSVQATAYIYSNYGYEFDMKQAFSYCY